MTERSLLVRETRESFVQSVANQIFSSETVALGASLLVATIQNANILKKMRLQRSSITRESFVQSVANQIFSSETVALGASLLVATIQNASILKKMRLQRSSITRVFPALCAKKAS